MARNQLNLPASDDEGGIIKITTWKNDSRYSMVTSSGNGGWDEFLGNQSISFTKEKSNSDSYIFVIL